MLSDERCEPPFNDLTPAQDELLSVLAEECAEVIQVVMKIQRHGLSSYSPLDRNNTPNLVLLQRELGDVVGAMRLLERAVGLIDPRQVEAAAQDKMLRVQKYLHHAQGL